MLLFSLDSFNTNGPGASWDLTFRIVLETTGKEKDGIEREMTVPWEVPS